MRTVLRIALAAASCVVPVGATGTGAGVPGATGLEHMAYAAARRIVLKDGWQPLTGGCEVVGGTTCSAFPEISSCSGVAPGQCGMVFVQRDRCLYVGTTGGQPGGTGADPRVETITFRPGPCAKQ